MSHNLLYMKATAHNARDVTLAFVVPAIKRQAAIDRCHHDSRHQGRACALSLLRERFWWLHMQVETMMAVKNCEINNQSCTLSKLPNPWIWFI